MARNETRKLAPDVLEADWRTLLAVLSLPGYMPANPQISLETIASIQSELEDADQDEIKFWQMFQNARRNRIRLQWARHNTLLAAKNYIRGSYGDDSEAMEAVGLVRKSARRRMSRRYAKARAAVTE